MARAAAFFFGILLCATAPLSLHAAEYAPRIQRRAFPDTLSLKTWASTLAPATARDDEYAARLLEAVTHPEYGLHPAVNGPYEGPEKLADFALVTDPVKLLHVYGYANRRQLAGVFVALWEASGRGRGRLVQLGETDVWLAEIESHGEWWVFDVARKVAAPIDKGFASLESLRKDARLREKIFSNSKLPAEQVTADLKAVATETPKRFYDAVATGHTAEFVLRRGTTFRRFSTPQGQRWAISTFESTNKDLLALQASEPAGPKDGKAQPPLHGNGVWIYQPDLTQEADLVDGEIDSDNVTVSPEGLTVKQDGVGWIIFEMHSPYPIVPELGKVSDPKDDKLAAVLELDGQGVTASCSIDNAATWITLETKKIPAEVDMTPQVAGTDGYLLRLELKGMPGQALVKSLKTTTWLQVAPRSWPRLATDKNELLVRRHDELGLSTRSFTHNLTTSNENRFLSPVIRPPQEFRPGHAEQRVIGPFTFRISPPLGTQLAWFDYGGRFAIDPQKPAAGRVILQHSLSAPREFSGEESTSLPSDHAGLHRQLARRVHLPDVSSSAYGRIDAVPALNEFRLITFGLDSPAKAQSEWSVVYRWDVGGEARTSISKIDGETESLLLEIPEAANRQTLDFVCPPTVGSD